MYMHIGGHAMRKLAAAVKGSGTDQGSGPSRRQARSGYWNRYSGDEQALATKERLTEVFFSSRSQAESITEAGMKVQFHGLSTASTSTHGWWQSAITGDFVLLARRSIP